MIYQSSFLKVSTKPPLCGRIIIQRATEYGVKPVVIVTEKVHNWLVEGAKATVSIKAEDVKTIVTRLLPECYCDATGTSFSKNIDILYWLARRATLPCHDIEVAEFAPEVIFVLDRLRSLVVARCTPMCRVFADAVHPRQCLTVYVPVWIVFVDWCVVRKCLVAKIR